MDIMRDQGQAVATKLDLSRYLWLIDPRSLIQPLEVDAEALLPRKVNAACLLCSGGIQPGALQLNDRRLICPDCLQIAKTQKYPEHYQQLYEDYLFRREARARARTSFIDSLPSRRLVDRAESAMGTAIALTALGVPASGAAFLFAKSAVLVVLVIWSGCAMTAQFFRSRLQKYRLVRDRDIATWDELNPPPMEPRLLQFHEPGAVLSPRDRLFLEIFDHWPGLPPFWEFVRRLVLERDDRRCQVTGCPSRLELQIHHKTPRAMGGSHRADNLVTLCMFHHGLVPHPGHERVWGEVRTRYFSMVRAHYRGGSPVRAHVRRRELAEVQDLRDICDYYRLTCRTCSTAPVLSLKASDRIIKAECLICLTINDLPRQLAEETGPLAASLFAVGRHPGIWTADLSLLESSRKPTRSGKKLAGAHPTIGRTHHGPHLEPCPRCGSRLLQRTGKYGSFVGCSAYPGCRFTRSG
jgi:hypothetical protein